MKQTPIKIVGLTSRGEEDSINASFDSIEKLIDEWKPKVTKQFFSTIAYFGPLTKDKKITVDKKPFEATPIFGIRGKTYILVGTLELSGVFTSEWDSHGENIIIYQTYATKE